MYVPTAADHAHQVEDMFGRIAGRYDLLNRLLSGRRDVAWRRKALDALTNPPGRFVDLACGTFDVGLEALARGKATSVVGLDFCLPMLQAGTAKRQGKPLAGAVGDCLRLPLASACARTVSIAYGWRNVSDPHLALQEMARVLEPGGELLILEFFRPTTWWTKTFYATFGRVIFPCVGGLIGGNAHAYRYLHDSIKGFLTFPDAVAMVEANGFTGVRTLTFFGGISHAILAKRAV